jgi:hypothetical protein
MNDHCDHAHVRELEQQVMKLSDALAQLGRGMPLQELMLVIRQPGWTTPAELAFVSGAIEHQLRMVAEMTQAQAELLAASRKVSHG